MPVRCRRCNIPHYRHEDAASSGGVGRLLRWRGDLCPICANQFCPVESGGNARLSDYE